MPSPASPLSPLSGTAEAGGPDRAVSGTGSLDTTVDATVDAVVDAVDAAADAVPAGPIAGPADEPVRDRAVVRLTDATFREGVAELRWRLRDHILSGVRVLVVDVSAVRQLSSTAVAALLGAHRSCRARGGGVIIRNPNRRTQDLLRRTGLWRVLRPEFTDADRRRSAGRRPEGG